MAGDAQADLHGSDVSAGFNLGVLYQIHPGLRFGVDYRSRIQHDISGTQSISVPAAYTSGALGLYSGWASDCRRARHAEFGGEHQDHAAGQRHLRRLLAGHAATRAAERRQLDRLVVAAIDQHRSDIAVGGDFSRWSENWHNTVAVSVGANYQLTKTLMLQTGAGYDQSPVTDFEPYPRIPDSNRYEISIGAQYQVMPNLTLASGLRPHLLRIGGNRVGGFHDVRRPGRQICRRRRHRQPWREIPVLTLNASATVLIRHHFKDQGPRHRRPEPRQARRAILVSRPPPAVTRGRRGAGRPSRTQARPSRFFMDLRGPSCLPWHPLACGHHEALTGSADRRRDARDGYDFA